jgi:hypothetical protein
MVDYYAPLLFPNLANDRPKQYELAMKTTWASGTEIDASSEQTPVESGNRKLPQAASRESFALRIAGISIVVWGLVLTAWVARVYFLYPAEISHQNHEDYAYSARLLEFRALLDDGYLSPQWCVDFRGGLGSPHWSYYQPGLFYVASLVPWSVPPVRALGFAVAAFAFLGYLSTYATVCERFGRTAGIVAASALVLAPYCCAEIYIRGDLSEYAAMMLVPLAMYSLAGWFDHGRPACAMLLTLSVAGLIFCHPCVALLGSGLLGMGLCWYAWQTRSTRRTLTALAAIGLGIALAGLYWVPVFFEWDLVQGDNAVRDDAGVPYYATRFVQPITRLFGPFDAVGNWAILDTVLGPLLAICAASFLCYRSRMTAEQRRLAGLSLLGAALFVFLMMQESSFLWRLLPPLQKIQFPWRSLSVLTVLVAIAAGSLPLWQHPHARLPAGLLVAAMLGLSSRYTTHQIAAYRVPQTTAAVAEASFTPDQCNEWVPRNASVNIPSDFLAGPTPAPGCQVDSFQRQPCGLRCRVRTVADSQVVLPHYYFPVGWHATLTGQPLPLSRDSQGLMRVELPKGAEGLLEIRFDRTPMRTAGLRLSGIALLAGAVFFGVLFRSSGCGSSSRRY